MRAVSDDQTASWSVGVRVERAIAIAWGLSAIMATTAGVLWGATQGVDWSLSLLLIKALAIATAQRSDVLKDVPTTKEAGLPDFQVSAWNAIFAPKGTPATAVAKLNAALVAALDDENTRKRLLELGSVIPDKAGRTPEALQTLVESEVARWTPVLKAAGAVAN